MELIHLKAIFLDRDGTIIEDKGYVHKIEDFKLLAGASDGIKKFNRAGFLVIIVSNQSGIGRGYYTEKDAQIFNEFLVSELKKQGAKIDDVFICPHYPESKIKFYQKICECRKPKPGMLLAAAAKYKIDLNSSWMIGNEKKDIDAGIAAGCKTVLISENTSHYNINTVNSNVIFVAKNLLKASEYILKCSPK